MDLGLLFDRSSPQGLLFPREPALQELLTLLNAPDLDTLWAEDETIGWIYQYYNDPAERKKMREAGAPRNSRELAVRNQFFTPRYVVEFLTDNTVGRIWYEMTQGETKLKEQCRYLVRRPIEIFLTNKYLGLQEPATVDKSLTQALAGNWNDLPVKPTAEELAIIATAIDPRCASRIWGDRKGDGFLRSIEERRLPNGGRYQGETHELWAGLFAVWALWAPQMHVDAWAIYEALRERLVSTPADIPQEALLKRPVFIPHRQIKDPRAIRMLDPACGSMHFGLYAFDLYEVIYEEAWDLGVESLRRDFSDKEILLCELPRLIIEHNIHGIDIDPRCAQIAGLSLWLRAQKSWQSQKVDSRSAPAHSSIEHRVRRVYAG